MYHAPHQSFHRAGVVGSFHPLMTSPFRDGAAGFVHDVSDLSTLFTDSGGSTTPVRTNGELVGHFSDLSDSNNDCTQGVTAEKPIYRTDGLRHWLQFDGSDDHMSFDTDLFTNASGELWVAYRQDDPIGNELIIGNSGSGNRRFYMFGDGMTVGTDKVDFHTDFIRSERDQVGGGNWPSSGTVTVVTAVNGQRNSGSGGSRSTPNANLELGSYGAGIQSHFAGRVYAMVGINNAQFTEAERTMVMRWLAEKAGANWLGR